MSGSDRKVVVWDLPVRLFHWAIVLLVASAYVTWQLNWMNWHVRAGYALMAAVLFRILWGFFGSDTARFSRFVAAPRAAVSHLAQALRREPDRQVGHNPAGGWMVLLFLLLLLAESLTGLYVNNDVADEGPFTELAPASVANAISALHEILWDALLAAIVLHVVAIIAYAAVKRHNLVRPMITGRKSLPVAVPAPRMTGWLRALILLGGSALAAAALAHFL
ncbi:MAG TPA: cytochrome b/b6 domain-containing protein [Steroidobacteraceae bacterium]|jgi:cytochrome b|nr:cytochrome b/b6 domain-containing protein [Steroidobacteraceae bacterium]